MLENQGSLATGKAGAGPTEIADVLSDEWQVEGREAGKMCEELEVGLKYDVFSFCRYWVLERFAEPYPLFCNIS